MPTLMEAKTLAGQGKYADALNMALTVFVEDDGSEKKADVLVFLGACYSALGKLPEAKYCYESVKLIQPEHPKLQIAMAGLEGVTAARPPQMAGESGPEVPVQPPESASPSTPKPGPEPGPSLQPQSAYGTSQDVWAEAFPDKPQKQSGGFLKLVVSLIVLGAIAWVLYELFGRPPTG